MSKAIFWVTMVLVATVAVGSAFAKEYTQKELKQCMEILKKDSAKKGYPITDPMVLRYKCTEILKNKR